MTTFDRDAVRARIGRIKAIRAANPGMSLPDAVAEDDRRQAEAMPTGPSYEDLKAEVAALRAQVARVRALVTDPRWEIPPDGTIIHATYSGGYSHGGATRPDREGLFVRTDGDDCSDPEGDWWKIGDGTEGRYSYGEVLAHDDPPEDRPTVSVEPLVYAYEILHALDGPLTGGPR